MDEASADRAIAHVSGVVIHAVPRRAAVVAAAIDAIDGAEVHAREQGRLVVVLEAGDEAGLNDLLDRIALMDGVHSAALVSHYRDEPDLQGDA